MSSETGPVQAPDSFTIIAPYYDKIMASVPYRFWVSYVEALWQTHGLKPTRVFDLCCGTGTVSLLLSAKGLDVIGADRSAPMIDEARRKSEKQEKKARFIVGDAAVMAPIHPPVDSTLCLFDSLNNILEPECLRTAIRTVRAGLVDGGLFIFDLNTAYAFRQGMFNQRSSALDEPIHYVWRSKYDERSRQCTVTMDFEIDARGSQPALKFTEHHVQRAYSRAEVEEMLADAGFEEVVAYDAYTLLPPRKRSDRIFWVAS